MVTTGAPRMKITYATLSAENEELQAAFDRALAGARTQLGERFPMLIGEERRFADEAADLLRYYSDVMERHGGFVEPMGSLSPAEHTRSVLKPHGVWAVISPFNFPMALSGGPAAGALIAGNTVVMKPSSDAPLLAFKFAEVLREVGVPGGAVNLVTGPGETVGAELEHNPGIDGLVFT